MIHRPLERHEKFYLFSVFTRAVMISLLVITTFEFFWQGFFNLGRIGDWISVVGFILPMLYSFIIASLLSSRDALTEERLNSESNKIRKQSFIYFGLAFFIVPIILGNLFPDALQIIIDNTELSILK